MWVILLDQTLLEVPLMRVAGEDPLLKELQEMLTEVEASAKVLAVAVPSGTSHSRGLDFDLTFYL